MAKSKGGDIMILVKEIVRGTGDSIIPLDPGRNES